MEPFMLFYLVYIVKIACQLYIYYIWLGDPTTATIIYFAGSVPLLSAVPVFHVFAHIFREKPFSDLSLGLYCHLSFVLAFLWYRPTTAAGGTAIFALVTVNDIISLLTFLLYKLATRYRKPEADSEHAYDPIKADIKDPGKPHKANLHMPTTRDHPGDRGSGWSAPFDIPMPREAGAQNNPQMVEVRSSTQRKAVPGPAGVGWNRNVMGADMDPVEIHSPVPETPAAVRAVRGDHQSYNYVHPVQWSSHPGMNRPVVYGESTMI